MLKGSFISVWQPYLTKYHSRPWFFKQLLPTQFFSPETITLSPLLALISSVCSREFRDKSNPTLQVNSVSRQKEAPRDKQIREVSVLLYSRKSRKATDFRKLPEPHSSILWGHSPRAPSTETDTFIFPHSYRPNTPEEGLTHNYQFNLKKAIWELRGKMFALDVEVMHNQNVFCSILYPPTRPSSPCQHELDFIHSVRSDIK